MSDDMTRTEYWKEVASLAESITEETLDEFDSETQAEIREDNDHNEFRDSLTERLHETIDSHQWVIFTAYNFDVMKFSPNDDYSVVNFGAESIVDETGLNTAVIAYGALCADVQEHSAFGVVEEEE